MNSNNEKISNQINNFKKINNSNKKKVNLCHKYFYKINPTPKSCNLFKLMENGLANQDELEQVDNACSNSIIRKNELIKQKIDCLKSMILNRKKIPEQWIVKNNYKNALNKVMEDPTILSYAIMSKDYYKKKTNSTSTDTVELENNLQNSISSQKFVTCKNPHSRNYSDSIEKHNLMKDYCYSLRNNKNKNRIFKTIESLNEQEKKLKEKKYHINTGVKTNNILPYIFPSLKQMKSRNKTKDFKDEKFMLTSIFYDENNINNKDNKIKREKEKEKEMNDAKNDNFNANEKNDNDNNNQRKSFELPMIDY